MKKSSPQNVLLICVDHWSGTLPPTVSHPILATPTLNQIAERSIRFSRAYSACPVCIPARRSLMTGLSARGHGDRCFDETMPFPKVPTLPQCFQNAGYQTFAVGKLHVFPRRSRIGFDEAIINEEGRRHLDGRADDWEMELASKGYGGKEYSSGVANNDYLVHPWHLPDDLHPTNWTAREMSRAIRRRDPSRPSFWYSSFTAPHPPMWPTRDYLDYYSRLEMESPKLGKWLDSFEPRPSKWRNYSGGAMFRCQIPTPNEILEARRAFFGLQTHVDHQIRVILGTLREEGLLDDTIIAFVSDHGDMLGHHGLWAKGVMYENSSRIPLLIAPSRNGRQLKTSTDDRLAEIRDVMPTLLDLAELPIPDHVEGQSLLLSTRREHLYGEHGEEVLATRMIVEEDFKLIYYPEGNRFQMFDLSNDPDELIDLAELEIHAPVRRRLESRLASELYGSDTRWIQDGKWIGLPYQVDENPNFSLSGQRGIRF